MTRLLMVLLFTSLTAFSAFVPLKVPFLTFGMPHALPGAEAIHHFHRLIFGYHVVSAQIVMVWLAGVMLGPRRGALSMILYLLLGLGFLPIFTDGGGWHYLMAPTFGYLLAFIPAAIVVGCFADTPRFGRLWAGMAYSLALIDACGLIDEVFMRHEAASLASWAYLATNEVLQFLPGQLALMTVIAFVVAVVRKADARFSKEAPAPHPAAPETA